MISATHPAPTVTTFAMPTDLPPPFPNHRCRARFGLAVALLAATLAGCAGLPTRHPVPEDLTATAEVPGIPNARIWGDETPPWIQMMTDLSSEQLKERFAASYGQPHNYLAISGGGPDGAFGAGLLNGWTAAGTRPEFTIVTGISTGALSAPFAFLGPKYDHVLKEVYTQNSTKDLIERRSYIAAALGESVADTALLRDKIAFYMTPEVMAEIAAAHNSGRRLFIGTVNLDVARPVIWNIGVIAASGQPGSLELIRNIMLASASVPGVFPPVYIPVTADGKTYDEMHVDGGTATQVFLYPVGLDWKKITQKLKVPGPPHAYIIRNSKLQADWESVEPWLPKIAGRSVSSLIRTQGIGDMYRMYIGAKRDGLDYNLVYIPDSFHVPLEEPFDPVYMNDLYALGYRMAKDGYPWLKAPPGMEEHQDGSRPDGHFPSQGTKKGLRMASRH
jgi:predicted acylesterase/phospholipase RssA